MFTPPISIAVTRKVRHGKEDEFEQALHEFVQSSLSTPDQLGVLVIRPAPGSDSREYGILRRFASNEERTRFYQSDLFKQWQERIRDLCEGPVYKEMVSGLETWFTMPGKKAVVSPPHWKMALTILMAVYPVTLIVPWLLHPVIQRVPALLGHLMVSVCVVATLTWIAMPLLNRLLKAWLHPQSDRAPIPLSHTPKPPAR